MDGTVRKLWLLRWKAKRLSSQLPPGAAIGRFDRHIERRRDGTSAANRQYVGGRFRLNWRSRRAPWQGLRRWSTAN